MHRGSRGRKKQVVPVLFSPHLEMIGVLNDTPSPQKFDHWRMSSVAAATGICAPTDVFRSRADERFPFAGSALLSEWHRGQTHAVETSDSLDSVRDADHSSRQTAAEI